MAAFDRLLIDPTPDELARVLEQAAGAANKGARSGLVRLTAKRLAGPLAKVAAAPEGNRLWSGAADGRPPRLYSLVDLVWWTDAIGRRHHRVLAWRLADPRHGRSPFARDRRKRPPLWQIYPARVFLRLREGHQEPVVWCRCGVSGTPADVAWMGEVCGPCHDRREEGTVPPALGPEQTVLKGHNGAVFGLAFSPDGKTLATGSMDCAVKLWDLATGRERAALAGHQSRVDAVVYAPDGTLYTGDDDGEVFFWDAAGERRRLGEGHGQTGFLGLALTPDGRRLAVKHSRLTVWDLVSGSRHDLATNFMYRGRVAVAWDGTLLAANDQGGRSLGLWDTRTGQPRGTLAGHADLINCVASSPDGRGLATGSDDKSVRIWDLASGQCRAVLRGHTGDVWGVAFSPDGGVLASVGSHDGTLRLWDLAAGAELAALAWHLDRVFSVAFASGGEWLATGGEDGTVKLWPWRALVGER
jgi:hypothetical protein